MSPPHTTDFAILYLPVEGLYAEALRRPGLTEMLQREWRISLAGPNPGRSAQQFADGFPNPGHRAAFGGGLEHPGAVKTEFGKFGEALSHTRKKLEEASSSIGKAETRTRVLSRKLKGRRGAAGGGKRTSDRRGGFRCRRG